MHIDHQLLKAWDVVQESPSFTGRWSAMVSSVFRLITAVALATGLRFDLVSAVVVDVSARAADPCAAIGGQKWVAPGAVRACFESFAVNQTIKNNVRTYSRTVSTVILIESLTDLRGSHQVFGLPYLSELSASRTGTIHRRCS